MRREATVVLPTWFRLENIKGNYDTKRLFQRLKNNTIHLIPYFSSKIEDNEFSFTLLSILLWNRNKNMRGRCLSDGHHPWERLEKNKRTNASEGKVKASYFKNHRTLSWLKGYWVQLCELCYSQFKGAQLTYICSYLYKLDFRYFFTLIIKIY